jgi:hypothetical protein
VPPDGEPAAAPPPAAEVSGFAAAGTGRGENPPAAATAADAPLAPSPARSLSWVFLDPADAAAGAAVARYRRYRTLRQAGVAAAGVLGVALIGALVIWLVPRLDPDPPARPLAATSSVAGQSAQSTPPPRQNGGGGALLTPAPQGPGAPLLTAAERAVASVVVEYFNAINHQNWQLAWSLGGDNLYPSIADLEASYAGVSHVAVTIVTVRGDRVLTHLTATPLTGAVITQTRGFIVQYGAIAASKLPP